jgi:hypothetical protein
VPKRNYGFEKRQKELNRQRKREEKQQRKAERAVPSSQEQIDPNEASETSRDD